MSTARRYSGAISFFAVFVQGSAFGVQGFGFGVLESESTLRRWLPRKVVQYIVLEYTQDCHKLTRCLLEGHAAVCRLDRLTNETSTHPQLRRTTQTGMHRKVLRSDHQGKLLL